MRQHDPYRGRAARRGTHPGARRRGAFTVVEFVLALGLFMGAVAVVGTTATTALSTRSGLQRAVDLDGKLGALVDEAATLPFVALISGVFDVPALCDGQPASAGELGQSCVTVAGQETRVSWRVELGPDAAGAAGGPARAADWVRVVASGATTSGFSSERSAVVRAPSPGWHPGTAAVRVEIAGDVAALTTPVLLVGGTGFDQLVDGALPSADGTVVLRGDVAACSSVAPCRVGLGVGANLAAGPTHDVVAPAPGDPAAAVVFDQDVLVQRDLVIVERSPAPVSAPTTVTVAAGDVGPGGAAAATVQLRDAANQPVPGWPVALAVTVGGEPARGVWAQPGACVTDGAGSCTASVRADGAAGQVWQLHATGGAATGSDTGTVGIGAAKLVGFGASVAQGGSGTVEVRALDSAGNGVAGVALTASGPGGVSVSGGVTSTDGVAELEVAVSPTAVSGPATLAVRAGALETTVVVQITGVARAVTAPSSVSMASGTPQAVQVVVADVNGDPVRAATVTATFSGGPVDVTARVSTSEDGTATLWLVADAPGTGTLRVDAGGSAATVEVAAT